MYNRDDIDEMLNELNEKMDKKIEDEVSYYLNMSGILFYLILYLAVYVQLLYHEVEKKNINVKVETSQVENM